jgi:hypothetical protein
MNGILQTFEGVFLTSPFKVVIRCFCGNKIFYNDLCMQNAKNMVNGWKNFSHTTLLEEYDILMLLSFP